MKNNWVKAKADIAEPDLVMWHDMNARQVVGLVGYIQYIYMV